MRIYTTCNTSRTAPAALLARNLTRLREAAGIEMSALALQLDWPHARLDSIEAGTTEARLDEIDALAAALRAEPADFFTRTAA